MTTVRSPDHVLYQGPLIAISSKNEEGKFDILPQHTNFITLIEGKLTLHLNQEERRDFDIESGIIHARDNVVQIFLGVTRPQTSPGS